MPRKKPELVHSSELQYSKRFNVESQIDVWVDASYRTGRKRDGLQAGAGAVICEPNETLSQIIAFDLKHNQDVTSSTSAEVLAALMILERFPPGTVDRLYTDCGKIETLFQLFDSGDDLRVVKKKKYGGDRLFWRAHDVFKRHPDVTICHVEREHGFIPMADAFAKEVAKRGSRLRTDKVRDNLAKEDAYRDLPSAYKRVETEGDMYFITSEPS